MTTGTPPVIERAIDRYTREHWSQLAAIAWRYYLRFGRVLLVVDERRTHGEDPVAVIAAGTVREQLCIKGPAEAVAVLLDAALARYDPATSLVLLVRFAGERGDFRTGEFRVVTQDPPPPVAAARAGN